MSRPPHRRRPLKRRALVVTEGKVTEPQYVERLRQWLRDGPTTSVTVKTIPLGRDPLAVVERIRSERRRAEAAGEPYEWCCGIVDVDRHASLDRALVEARRAEIHVVVSNPKFEVWLLWHYRDHAGHLEGATLDRMLADLGCLRGNGKDLADTFPIEAFDDASRRARAVDRATSSARVGPNPSSAMPVLVDLMRR